MKRKLILAIGFFQMVFGKMQAKETPNILFIFADDMSYNCMGNIGIDNLHTPHLDELRKGGMHFTHAFNQGGWNGAISMASRAMLNTGKYLWKAKKIMDDKEKVEQIDDNQPHFWGQYMRRAGYETYMTGKWHVMGVDPQKVFDHVVHILPGGPRDSKPGYACFENNKEGRKFIPGQEDEWQPYKKEYGGYWEGGKHWSEMTGDDAVNFIQMAKDKDTPFFMYIAFNAPHDPRQSPKRFVDMYPLDKVSVPKNFQPLYPYYREVGCGEQLRDERLAPFPRTEYAVKVNRQEYYAIISHLDEQIGRIIQSLKESGKYENTYIIFTADHGLAVGDHGFIGKQNMYEASMRVPLIIAGPNVKKGKCHQKVYLQDVMATSMDIAQSSDLQRVDFSTLLPLLGGKKKGVAEQGEEEVYGAFINFQRMIRTDRYKMILYPKANMVRLYDLKKDPYEKYDLAKSLKYKSVMDDLLVRLEKKQKETGDDLDIVTCYRNFFASHK